MSLPAGARGGESRDSVVESAARPHLSLMPICLTGEHRWGAKGEQTYALNSPERSSTDLNGPALTCESPIFTGQRDMPNIVHTYGLFEVCSTDLNCIEPQVNGRERHRHEPRHWVSSIVLLGAPQIRSPTNIRICR